MVLIQKHFRIQDRYQKMHMTKIAPDNFICYILRQSQETAVSPNKFYFMWLERLGFERSRSFRRLGILRGPRVTKIIDRVTRATSITYEQLLIKPIRRHSQLVKVYRYMRMDYRPARILPGGLVYVDHDEYYRLCLVLQHWVEQ